MTRQITRGASNLPGKEAADPLQDIKRAVVAIGTLPNATSPSDDQLYYDGASVDFSVEGTGFLYSHTPLEFAEGKSAPDPKTGAVYYWARLWIVTCKHCVRDMPIVAGPPRYKNRWDASVHLSFRQMDYASEGRCRGDSFGAGP